MDNVDSMDRSHYPNYPNYPFHHVTSHVILKLTPYPQTYDIFGYYAISRNKVSPSGNTAGEPKGLSGTIRELVEMSACRKLGSIQDGNRRDFSPVF